MFGYMGRIFRVDLSKMRVGEEELNERVAEKYLGGSGLSAKILYDELKPGIDPLSKENKVVFSTGPLTGTLAPCAGMYVVSSKSPLTSLWGHSVSGGFFGAELKFAGYDALVIEGQADNPVYLWITPDEAEIEDATDLWNKDVYETTEILQKRRKGARVACIGLAGENLVRFAAVVNDKYRAAGRMGMGAVMGSKKLKAIAVKGSKRPEIARPGAFDEVVREVRKLILSYPGTSSRRAYGTSGGVEYESKGLGNTPTKYFQEAVFEDVEKISGEYMAETILEKRIACFGCPIGCGRYIKIRTGPYAGLEGGGPEYETLAAFGSLLLNADITAIAKANDMCSRLGIDSISCGSVIAFNIKCREKGWINPGGAFNLSWGDQTGIISVIEKIAKREGFGDVLAGGVKKAAEKIGKNASELALHVKGLELPMHDPRAQPAIGLQYATSPRGAVHKPFTGYVELFNRGVYELNLDPENYDRFSTKGKAYLTKTMQDLHMIYDSAILCMFAYPPTVDSIKVSHVARLLSLATGFDLDVTNLMKIGERIWNLQKLFNVREGASRRDDTLPKKMLEEPHSEGPIKGRVVPLNPMLEEYYNLRGMTQDGIPTREKLTELGLLEA